MPEMDYMPRTKTLLRFLDLWPPKDEQKRMYELRQLFNIALVFYFMTGVITYPFSVIQDANIPFSVKIESFLVLACLGTMLYNYLCTYYLRHKFMALFVEMEQFDKFGLPADAHKTNKFIDSLSVLLVLYCSLGGTGITAIPLINIAQCINYNKLHNGTLLCGYAARMRYPYSISSGYLYYIHLAIELYGVLTLCCKGVLFFGLGLGSFEAVIIRLNHLISRLQQVFADDDFSIQKAWLRHSIMYHIHIIELADQVNECLALVTMPCIICYNIIIGLGLLAALNDPSILSVVITIGWVSSLFVACISGERLITKSTAVGEVAYAMRWYADTRLRRDIQFMILMSQKPIRFQCGNLGELSLLSFKKIMQGAYTYATMRNGLGK